MSPRAAWRLESIGFTRVYDYVAGKADCGSFGLTLEGRNDSRTRAASIVRADTPTCRLDEQVAEVASPACRLGRLRRHKRRTRRPRSARPARAPCRRGGAR